MGIKNIAILVCLAITIYVIVYYTSKASVTKFESGTKMLIFDFDGTIADSLPALIECLNNNASYYGYKKADDLEQLRSKDTKDFLKELGISSFWLPFVVRTIRKDMVLRMSELKPFPSIVDVLTQLHNQGILLGIVSSNSQENIEQFLQAHNINFFSLIHGQSSIFGKSKILKNLLSDYGLDASSVIYIGDELRDIEAAKNNKMRCIGVTWGFNTATLLQEQQPDYLINDPQELLMLGEKL